MNISISKKFLPFLITLLSFSGCISVLSKQEVKYNIQKNKGGIEPPIAKIIPHVDTTHGDIRIDNYYWLRNKTEPDIIKHLEKENEYTEVMMKNTKKLQDKLFNEMKARIKETDSSVPVKKGNYYYYSRTEKGKDYRIYCRKKGSMDAEESILLDVNELANGHNFFNIGAFSISPDNKLLAYSFDTTGAEAYILHIKNLETGNLLMDKLEKTDFPVIWTNDNKTIFYTTLDSTNRPYRVFRHRLGENQYRDKLLYQEDDGGFFVYLSKSKSKKYIYMKLQGKITSEIRLLDANFPNDTFSVLYPRKHGIEYDIVHHEDKFFILTNENAKNFKVMEVEIEKPSVENLKVLIKQSDTITINDFEIFKGHLVLYERSGGLDNIKITDLKKDNFHNIEFPEPVYSIWEEENPEYSTNNIRFSYSSFTTPSSVFEYNMVSREMTLLKQDEIPGGYNKSLYKSERLWAIARDSTKIPISIVYKGRLKKDGSNPMLLEGYGAYGACYDPYFSTGRLSLLDRGFIFGIANIRGGGEMGREWYEDGKFLNKKNTLTDFIDCSEYLISEGYTSTKNLVISGESAGGLLIGAVLNMRPNLFKAAVMDVPFVDVLNTMLDESIPLTVLEYDEWGNPNEEEYYYYMKSYSPYDNIKSQNYPHLLVTAGFFDRRVAYWEPAKWVAKIRAMKTSDNILLLKTNMKSGHSGSSGRYEKFKDRAFKYVFILNLFEIEY